MWHVPVLADAPVVITLQYANVLKQHVHALCLHDAVCRLRLIKKNWLKQISLLSLPLELQGSDDEQCLKGRPKVMLLSFCGFPNTYPCLVLLSCWDHRRSTPQKPLQPFLPGNPHVSWAGLDPCALLLATLSSKGFWDSVTYVNLSTFIKDHIWT